MGHRLMILMVLGLSAMYMLHLLAQDWNALQRPSKRSLTRLVFNVTSRSHFVNWINDAKHQHNYIYNNSTHNKIFSLYGSNIKVHWKHILSRDPFQCLESLVCQIVSDAKEESFDANVLRNFIEVNMKMIPLKICRAYRYGVTWRGNTQYCFSKYPLCWYSAKTMFKIMKLFLRPIKD